MITRVEPALLVAGTEEVVTNVETTGGIIAGGAGVVAAAAPAGADDVSLLASSSSTAHAANFLAISAVEHAQTTVYGAALSNVAVNYVLADNAVKF